MTFLLFSIFQTMIFSLLALSVFVKLWKHSISTFLILAISAATTIIYAKSPEYAMGFYMLSLCVITARAVLKPDDDVFIKFKEIKQ